jgi:predicted  nucleic acid-binding Zn-ribbon protein
MNDAAVDITDRRPATGQRRQKAAEQKPNLAEAAEVLLPQLEEKVSAAKARQTAITGERNAVALAAHMGSSNDRARLDELNQEGAILAGEIEGLEAAITQAKARIAEAETNAAAEADRGKRREILRLADEIRGHAERIDALWRQSIEEYDALQRKLTKVVQAGVGRPTQQQVRVACQRALVAVFIGTPLQSQLLPPNERHTVVDLVGSWANAAEAWAGRNAA